MDKSKIKIKSNPAQAALDATKMYPPLPKVKVKLTQPSINKKTPGSRYA